MTVDEALRTALDHHCAGRLAQAEAIYQQVLQHEPHNAEALHLLGVLADQSGKREMARDLTGRAVALRGDIGSYHAIYASALAALGQLDQAAVSYERALQLQPDLVHVHYNLGKVLQAQGQLAAAIAHYRHAVAANASHAELRFNLGTALEALGDFNGAIAEYQTAIALNPSDNKTYGNLANALLKADRALDAINVYAGAIGVQQADAYTQRRLAGTISSNAQIAAENGQNGGSAFFPTVDNLAVELERLRAAGDVDGSLGLILRFVRMCIFDRRGTARIFGNGTLDSACQRIGADQFERVKAAHPVLGDEDQADCVILATELYRSGGHTAVIEDLINTRCFGPRTVVMLTDVFNSADPSIADERFGPEILSEIAPRGGLAGKLTWVLDRLRTLKPRRLILMNHHNDGVAVAAAQPSLADETIFYHHGDHQLCLGVTLPHAVHVDPHPMGHFNCRTELGIQNQQYWPFVARDAGMRKKSGWMLDGCLRTCSTGAVNKFEAPYKYPYADVVQRVIACTGGVHVHIGPLSEATLAQIRNGLSARGIPPQRFVHVPWVRSVWKALQAFEIDVMVASFPLGGGKALIEAMGSGTPVIGHDCYISEFLGGGDLFYPSAYLWTHPDELIERLRALSPDQLERESEEARQHFERFHTIDALTRAITQTADAPPVPTSKRPHRQDPLQLFLDDLQYAQRDYATHLHLIR